MDPRYEALILAYEEYIDLTHEEIESLLGIALVHGWKSTRVEKGIVCRANIAELKRMIGAQHGTTED